MQIGATDATPGSRIRLARTFSASLRRGLALALIALGLTATLAWRLSYGRTMVDRTYDAVAGPERWTFPPPVGRKTDHPIFLAFQRDWGKPAGDDRAIATGAWKARMTALCELARLGPVAAIPLLFDALDDGDDEVRDLAAQASGYLGDRSMLNRLERTIREDPSAAVRIYASIARRSIAGDPPQELARDILRHDPHSIVRARLELALARGAPSGETITRDRLAEYDLALMDTAHVGAAAPDFVLNDLNGAQCRLSDYRDKQPVVLVFVYGVTCMFCTGQVANLRAKIDEFEALGAKVLIVEANEPYRVRATARGALISANGDPRIPVLFDSAHTVAATYGVAMQMNHVEWLNRPSTFLIDREGVLRKTFLAESPADRPSPTILLDEVRAFGAELAVAEPADHTPRAVAPTRSIRRRLHPQSRAFGGKGTELGPM